MDVEGEDVKPEISNSVGDEDGEDAAAAEISADKTREKLNQALTKVSSCAW